MICDPRVPLRARFKTQFHKISRKSWRKQYVPQRYLRDVHFVSSAHSVHSVRDMTTPPPSHFGVWSHVENIIPTNQRFRSLNDVYNDPRSVLQTSERSDKLCAPCEQPVVVLVESGATKNNLKRKRMTYACEHGVKYLSQCKMCRICSHGDRRHSCKHCGVKRTVHRKCEHGRFRFQCVDCGGSQICEHRRRRYYCKECKKCKEKGASIKNGAVILITENPQAVAALELLKLYE